MCDSKINLNYIIFICHLLLSSHCMIVTSHALSFPCWIVSASGLGLYWAIEDGDNGGHFMTFYGALSHVAWLAARQGAQSWQIATQRNHMYNKCCTRKKTTSTISKRQTFFLKETSVAAVLVYALGYSITFHFMALICYVIWNKTAKRQTFCDVDGMSCDQQWEREQATESMLMTDLAC